MRYEIEIHLTVLILRVTLLSMVLAQDLIFEPTNRGDYIIETDIIHWVSGEVLGTTKTKITVV